MFHHQSLVSLNYGYGNFLNRYGDYVEKQTVYVAIPEPCIIYCNLFITGKIRNLTLEPPCCLRTDSVRRKFVERNSVLTVAKLLIINLLVQTIFHTKRIYVCSCCSSVPNLTSLKQWFFSYLQQTEN